ncbi:hypothetical protein B0H13DRAFT_1909561 [Mycena leptocephala]|nr:hypothetical protein B0H13DRAFT_1909561 [Mycena leptocephala]
MAPKSQPDSSTVTGECRAHDKESGQECDCTEYQDDPEQPGYCSERYHRRKAHLAAAPGAPNSSAGVKAILAKLVAGSTGKGKLSLKAPSSASRKPAFPTLSAANRESNSGMRPTPKDAGTSKSAKRKKKDNSTNTFKVVSVVVLPHGTEWDVRLFHSSPVLLVTDFFGLENGTLRIVSGHVKTPNKSEIQKAAAEGVAVVDTSEGYELDRLWDHEELVDAFATLLPLPFSLFEQLERDAEDGEPAWCLATVVQKRLEVLNNSHPTGKDVDFHKGNPTSGFRTCRVFIVSREPIPSNMLKDWARQSGAESTWFSKPDTDENNKTESDDTDSASDSASLDGSPSPEKIPRQTKRRLVSKSSSDDEDSLPAKKRGKVLLAEPGIATDSDGEGIIDLTADDGGPAAQNTGLSKSRASSEESVFEDPLIGNPYDKDHIYEF